MFTHLWKTMKKMGGRVFPGNSDAVSYTWVPYTTIKCSKYTNMLKNIC